MPPFKKPQMGLGRHIWTKQVRAIHWAPSDAKHARRVGAEECCWTTYLLDSVCLISIIYFFTYENYTSKCLCSTSPARDTLFFELRCLWWQMRLKNEKQKTSPFCHEAWKCCRTWMSLLHVLVEMSAGQVLWNTKTHNNKWRKLTKI